MLLPALEKHQVQVWTMSLEAEAAKVRHCESLLASEELARANRFSSLDHRQRFIMARASLRKILSFYTNSNAATLHFEYGPKGKPSLSGNSSIHFNLSYSRNMAMVAVSMQRELGIDIQAIAQVTEPESVARLVFSPTELSYLLSLDVHERQLAFTHIWVRKEAYIKALGTGFSRTMHTFSVSAAPGDIDALCSDEINHLAMTEWRLMEINAPKDYCAALAAAGRNWELIEMMPDANLLNPF